MPRITRGGRMRETLDRYQRALPAALTAAGMVVVTRVQRLFVVFKPAGWATGHTARSVTVSPPYYDGAYMRVKVGPTTAYAWWVEFGRKPGKWPPRENILAWVKEKHIAGTYAIVGTRRGGYPRYKRSGSKAQRQREDEQAAYLIARKIGEKGTRPHPYLTSGFRQSKDAALRVFVRVIAQGVLLGGRE